MEAKFNFFLKKLYTNKQKHTFKTQELKSIKINIWHLLKT